MYAFAEKVAKNLDELTTTKNAQEVVERCKEPLQSLAFDLKAIHRVYEQLARATKTTVQIPVADPSKTIEQATSFLIALAMEKGECDVSHLKTCERHQVLLTAMFQALLSGLIGINLERVFEQFEAIIKQISELEIRIQPKSVSEHRSRMANWGLLLTDPEMLLHVAQRMHELPENVRGIFLERLSSSVGALQECPDHQGLEVMIRRAVLGYGKAN